MIDLNRVKMHMASGGCLNIFDPMKQEFVEEFSAVAILDDMRYPTALNAGQTLVARVIKLSEGENEVSLSRSLLRLMYAEGHNAIAFLELDETKVRFSTLKF